MAVIITNMDMPKSCDDCEFHRLESGFPCILSNNNDCPLKSADDYTPVIHAKWVSNYGNVECSNCGHCEDAAHVGKATHYCSFCGARMIEPQESEDKG